MITADDLDENDEIVRGKMVAFGFREGEPSTTCWLSPPPHGCYQ